MRGTQPWFIIALDPHTITDFITPGLGECHISKLINGFGFESLRAFAIAGALALACSTAPPVCSAGVGVTPGVTTYTVKGVFQELGSGGRVAVIAHEKIAGYMEAMTMPFNVKRPAEFRRIRPGDEIVFRLSVTETLDWIDHVRKVGSGAKTATSAPVQTDAVKELEPGALVPDCVLTNQDGEVIHTTAFKGQALAFTFFFSRCPLPSFCPRMNNNLASAQKALRSDGIRTNWQLLSISFDPGFDTPQQLKDFATLHQIDHYHWDFATSNPDEIRKLGGAFGLKFWREKGSFRHNLRTVVVNAAGRVQKVFAGNDWEPAELVEELRKAMAADP